ncbi:MAG TPA: heliorhodopsin HeR, partial [Tepidiformaceae bacterium]|nr:heliorhodopsin HeR [Tepidiformaceae bacterium]
MERRQVRRLRLYNLAMGAAHAVQGAVILALANDFSLPVTATFMEGPPGDAPPVIRDLFDLRVAWGIAAFVFMSAAAHFTIVLPGVFSSYVRNLERNRNYARWVEYSVSSSIMIVLIAMLTGISDVAAMLGLFGVNASMILFGLVMEHYEEPGQPNWLSFWFGCLAGVVPWMAISLNIFSPGFEATPPGFVIGIFISLFVFFNCFALNMWLQYRQAGPWRNYVFGESVYVFLSLT